MFPNTTPGRRLDSCTLPEQASQSLHQPSTFAAMSLKHILAGLLAIACQVGCCGPLTAVDADAHYPEGPLWHRGRLYYVEYSAGNIKTWDGKRTSVFWHGEGCGPSGLASRGDDILIACYDGNYLLELDPAGHEKRQLRADIEGRPFTGPNDFAPDDRGGLYFSASGAYDVKAPITGAVLYLRADGTSVVQVATLIHYPNGLTLSKDRRQLLVAEMLASRILSFPIASDGSLGPRRVWARLQDLAPPTPAADAYNGPDGLKLGPDGNYYVAQNGSGRVLVANEQGKLVRRIDVPAPYVTNMAFGDRGDLFVTAAFEQWKPPFQGTVYRVAP